MFCLQTLMLSKYGWWSFHAISYQFLGVTVRIVLKKIKEGLLLVSV
jgi:hypothetical protein